MVKLSLLNDNLLYDDVTWLYHVITNLTGEKAKQYTCKACNKEC